MVGLLDTAEIPNLKEIFRDETIGVVACHCIGGKFVIHSQAFTPLDKRGLEVAQELNVQIDEAFRQKGVTKLHTWAETDEQYRYNLFLGYKPTGCEVVIDGYPQTVYEFEKDL